MNFTLGIICHSTRPKCMPFSNMVEFILSAENSLACAETYLSLQVMKCRFMSYGTWGKQMSIVTCIPENVRYKCHFILLHFETSWYLVGMEWFIHLVSKYHFCRIGAPILYCNCLKSVFLLKILSICQFYKNNEKLPEFFHKIC